MSSVVNRLDQSSDHAVNSRVPYGEKQASRFLMVIQSDDSVLLNRHGRGSNRSKHMGKSIGRKFFSDQQSAQTGFPPLFVGAPPKGAVLLFRRRRGRQRIPRDALSPTETAVHCSQLRHREDPGDVERSVSS